MDKNIREGTLAMGDVLQSFHFNDYHIAGIDFSLLDNTRSEEFNRLPDALGLIRINNTLTRGSMQTFSTFQRVDNRSFAYENSKILKSLRENFGDSFEPVILNEFHSLQGTLLNQLIVKFKELISEKDAKCILEKYGAAHVRFIENQQFYLAEYPKEWRYVIADVSKKMLSDEQIIYVENCYSKSPNVDKGHVKAKYINAGVKSECLIPKTPSMTTVQFVISDVNGIYIPDAKVNFSEEKIEKHSQLSYNPNTGYTLEFDPSSLDENARIEVRHGGYEPVEVELSRLRESRRIYLGERGSKYIRRGNLDMPYILQADKAGAILVDPQSFDSLGKIIEKYQLSIELLEGSDNIVLLTRIDGSAIDQELYQQLRQSGKFLSIGPLINERKDNFAFLTNQLDIQFSDIITSQEITLLYQKYHLEQLSTYKFAPQFFRVKTSDATGVNIIEMVDAIREHKAVTNVDIQIYENIGQRRNTKGFGHR